MKALTLYLLVVNGLALLCCGLDKHRARKHAWRLPESLLMFLAALGGAVGLLLGMGVFRHKTKRPKFVYGVTVLLILHLLIACVVLL